MNVPPVGDQSYWRFLDFSMPSGLYVPNGSAAQRVAIAWYAPWASITIDMFLEDHLFTLWAQISTELLLNCSKLL